MGEGYSSCLYCFGAGYVVIGPEPQAEPETDSAMCPVCKGAGKTLCARCEGDGRRPSTFYNVETERVEPRNDLDWKRELVGAPPNEGAGDGIDDAGSSRNGGNGAAAKGAAAAAEQHEYE